MPVMDGFTATRKLRETPAWRTLPVIALTANAMVEDQEACLAAGMNSHVAKPIRMEALYESMAKCLPDLAAPTVNETNAAMPRSTANSLPKFPGINVAVGLAHVGGKQMLLLRILKQFRDTQGQHFGPQFDAAHLAGDWLTATRLAHSLKGVAHTIGATDLGEAAQGLEAAAANHDGAKCAELLPPLLTLLQLVTTGLAEIDGLLEAINKPSRTFLPEANPKALLARLAAMLAQHDTEAVELALEITPHFADSRQRYAWEAVGQAIERYDYGQASAALDSLQQKLTIASQAI